MAEYKVQILSNSGHVEAEGVGTAADPRGAVMWVLYQNRDAMSRSTTSGKAFKVFQRVRAPETRIELPAGTKPEPDKTYQVWLRSIYGNKLGEPVTRLGKEIRPETAVFMMRQLSNDDHINPLNVSAEHAFLLAEVIKAKDQWVELEEI